MKHLRKFKPRALLDMTLVISYQVMACEQGAAVPISKYITRYVFMDLIKLKKRRKEKLKYDLKSDRHPLSQMQVKVGLFSRSILHIYRRNMVLSQRTLTELTWNIT